MPIDRRLPDAMRHVLGGAFHDDRCLRGPERSPSSRACDSLPASRLSRLMRRLDTRTIHIDTGHLRQSGDMLSGIELAAMLAAT